MKEVLFTEEKGKRRVTISYKILGINIGSFFIEKDNEKVIIGQENKSIMKGDNIKLIIFEEEQVIEGFGGYQLGFVVSDSNNGKILGEDGEPSDREMMYISEIIQPKITKKYGIICVIYDKITRLSKDSIINIAMYLGINGPFGEKRKSLIGMILRFIVRCITIGTLGLVMIGIYLIIIGDL